MELPDPEILQKLPALVSLLHVMKSHAHKNELDKFKKAKSDFDKLLTPIEKRLDKKLYMTFDYSRNGYANSFQKFPKISPEKQEEFRKNKLKEGDDNLKKLEHLLPSVGKSGMGLLLLIIALAAMVYIFFRYVLN